MSDDAQYDIALQIQVASEAGAVPSARLEHAITWVLARHDVAAGASVSVVVTSDEEVRQLNRTYRGIDKPTDVLSFPAEPLPFVDEDIILGDLILALPYIQRQAAREGHTWHDEMVLAVIHGTLHLLGYDHDTAENQTAMWAVQAEALAAMNVSITVPFFEFDADDDDESSDE